ncbi:MAG: lamin tail domain-containing protein, partial [Akkermansiaceae bacterium]|nr:lamin tail domain-containing protein [Akkermansiaceae bacterium]
MKSICIICLAMATCAGGQVVINEFMAANTQAHPDIVDFDDYPDWIELKNTSAEAVSLDGYFLSDDPSNPLKWPLAPTASIPANGYFLVWADGHDTVPGQSFPRGYWPWRNFTTEGYHASFNLSSGGESVVLTKATDLATTTLVHAASPVPEAPATVAVWKYLADGSDQSTQWRARSFDDSGWSSGPGVLGYGDPWIETTVPYGSSASNKYITTYFRHTFQVADPATVANLALRLLVDDGAVVYLNGAEVVRQNLPAGEPNYRTLASLAIGGSDELDYSIYNISPTNLVAGDNVLAVEVHQVGANSSDQGFDVGLEATTFFSAAIVDSVGYGPQLDDVSMGRDPALESSWVSFATATPGAAN